MLRSCYTGLIFNYLFISRSVYFHYCLLNAAILCVFLCLFLVSIGSILNFVDKSCFITLLCLPSEIIMV